MVRNGPLLLCGRPLAILGEKRKKKRYNKFGCKNKLWKKKEMFGKKKKHTHRLLDNTIRDWLLFIRKFMFMLLCMYILINV